jgi:type II secretory pathway component PulJ
MMMHQTTKRTAQGFTLIEMIVYTGLLVILGLAISGFMFHLTRLNARAGATTQALSDARQVLAVITHEIRHAASVYEPTSTFNSHPGQLSLQTVRHAPVGHSMTYVDMYVDEGGVYVKREGSDAQRITSPKTRVTDLVFTYLNADEGGAVRIAITVEPDREISHSTVTLYATASLRWYE